MKAAVLKLKPNSQFHFGKVGLDENMSLNATSEYLHSDTLFSAMVNFVNDVTGDADQVCAFIDDIEDGKIVFSSGFYMLSVGDKDIFFLPKPVNASVAEKENYKDLKKIKFVSKSILEEGISPDKWADECISLNEGKFVCKKTDIEDIDNNVKPHFYSVLTEPKVKVRTKEQTDRLYYQANIMISDNQFLNTEHKLNISFYFLYDIEKATETNRKLFNLFLDMLPEIGIGGQRSTGAGFVKEVIKDVVFKYEPKNADKFLGLSLLIPKDEEEFNKMEHYNLITRGGRNSGSDNKKLKRVRMLTEGSIAQEKLTGKTEDISPDGTNNYLRNGKGFFIELSNNF